MSVATKMKKICDNIRLRTGGTELLTLDDIAEAVMQIGEATDSATTVFRTIGTTYPPVQLPATPKFEGYDIDVLNATANDIYAYIDEVVSDKNTVTKEIMGKDASGQYDVARYIYANRQQIAWQRQNYPKMYAWKNGNTTIYSSSVSPRIGDNMYVSPRIGDKYGIQAGTKVEIVTVPGKAVILRGYRYSHSGQSWSASSAAAALIVPLHYENDSNPASSKTHVLTLGGAKRHGTYTGHYVGTTPTVFPGQANTTWNSSRTEVTLTCGGTGYYGDTYGVVFLERNNSETFENTTVTIDGVSLDVIVTDNLDDVSLVAHATTEEVEVEAEAIPATITAVSATNRSRTINGLEFVRYAEDDVEPTVIYTALGDSRNNNATIIQDGITYNRYPLGDLGANQEKLIPIFIYANEHGIFKDTATNGEHEHKMCSLVVARLLRDLASGVQETNPLYKFIREHCMFITVPVANPYGYNYNVSDDTTPGIESWNTGYINANAVNINRNYDTPGWDVSFAEEPYYHGSYPGSENETQYIMNTMVESGAVVAMSLHEHSALNNHLLYQGQDPDGSYYNTDSIAKIKSFIMSNYGYDVGDYDEKIYREPAGSVNNTPDITCKSPSYITQCGAYGGIVEFTTYEANATSKIPSMSSTVLETAYAYVLNLTAMWLFDYLESVNDGSD